MTMSHDDPRLTAYVLGEASDEEIKAVETALAADPRLAEEISALRTAAQQVRVAVTREELPTLSDTLQHTVVQAEQHATIITLPQRTWMPPKPMVGLLAAAAVVTATIWAPSIWKQVNPGARIDAEILPEPKPMRIAEEPGDQPERIEQAEMPVPSAPPVTTKSPSLPSGTSYGAGMASVNGAKRLLRSMDDEGSTGLAAPAEPLVQQENFNTERYQSVEENRFELVSRRPLSTFGIDVDTASYSNVRRFLLQQSQLPPKDSVRIEELINYFPTDAAQPTDGRPFAVHTEVTSAPWAPTHRLVRVTLKGKEVAVAERPASNLVFLIDVSGSMDEPNKLPLLQRSLKLLVDQLTSRDRVAMVVYAGTSGLVLPSTPGNKKSVILDAIEHLSAGGSTNGGEGIMLAYQTARANLLKDGNNRVILATDGDFNVGVTGDGQLTRVIGEQAKSGVFLSVLGFGMGNYKDAMLEQLADKGNGNYAYIDTLNEARKVLVSQSGGTLVTIAKDVKLQVEFNPHAVAGYRLIGYENRLLRDEDFHDDTKDSGDMGAGHTVTALYEVIPVGVPVPTGKVDALKYQPVAAPEGARDDKTANEMMTVKLRYKAPKSDTSELMSVIVNDSNTTIEQASSQQRFSAAVAEFGMLLKGSEFKGNASFDQVQKLASGAIDKDPDGLRAEFLNMVTQAKILSTR